MRYLTGTHPTRLSQLVVQVTTLRSNPQLTTLDLRLNPVSRWRYVVG